MYELLEELGIPDYLYLDLKKEGLINETTKGCLLTNIGKEKLLLLNVINNEEDISDVYRKMQHLKPNLNRYELITDNITDNFIDGLNQNPDFIRILICSPWISLKDNHFTALETALLRVSGVYKNYEVKVITKTFDKRTSANVKKTITKLKGMNVEIVYHSNIHTKLYIKEPGPNGGVHYGILGSENLTGAGHIELAIKISNDNEILKNLHKYFYNVWEQSQISEVNTHDK
jgi:hypothetical protein